MPFVSVTRLRIRSIRFLPFFAVQALRSLRQVKAAAGFRSGSLLTDRAWTFWTMTIWDDEAGMRAYMMGGPHRVAMPRLAGWCDEASVVHWTQPDATLPSWPEADRRMRETGRPSKVRHPSRHHAGLTFAPPRIVSAGPIKAAKPAPAR